MTYLFSSREADREYSIVNSKRTKIIKLIAAIKELFVKPKIAAANKITSQLMRNVPGFFFF